MNRLLLLIIFAPLFANAEINKNYSFPINTTEKNQYDMNLLVACCEKNASCCIDFSEISDLAKFKKQVKEINVYQARYKESLKRAEEIKNRLHKRQLYFDQRYETIRNRSNQNR